MPNDPKSPSTSTASTAAEVALAKRFKLVVALVRTHIRDHPELNRLIAGNESSDRQIAMAILQTIDDFNNTPPLIDAVKLNDFPNIDLLIRGSLVRLLTSVAMLQTRNQLNYSDGKGVYVGVSDKSPMLMRWISLLDAGYQRDKKQLKLALNLRGALNGSSVSSEYSLINGLFDGTNS
jgi:hypothetical protein